MLKVIFQDKRFQRYFERQADGKFILDYEIANRMLRKLSPLCCFLGNEVMSALTDIALGKIN